MNKRKTTVKKVKKRINKEETMDRNKRKTTVKKGRKNVMVFFAGSLGFTTPPPGTSGKVASNGIPLKDSMK